jgi:hypothetical protein
VRLNHVKPPWLLLLCGVVLLFLAPSAIGVFQLAVWPDIGKVGPYDLWLVLMTACMALSIMAGLVFLVIGIARMWLPRPRKVVK